MAYQAVTFTFPTLPDEQATILRYSYVDKIGQPLNVSLTLKQIVTNADCAGFLSHVQAVTNSRLSNVKIEDTQVFKGVPSATTANRLGIAGTQDLISVIQLIELQAPNDIKIGGKVSENFPIPAFDEAVVYALPKRILNSAQADVLAIETFLMSFLGYRNTGNSTLYYPTWTVLNGGNGVGDGSAIGVPDIIDNK